MTLTILGSGSSGNCYLLESSSGQCLMIECGVLWKQIKQGLNFNLSNVAGVLISHSHKDHCKAVADVLTAGMEIYCSPGTWDAMKDDKMTNRRTRIVRPFVKYPIGEFKVTPFVVMHDAPDPLGFIIEHPECGKVMFATDTYYIPNTFKGLNNIMLEANYCSEIVRERMMNDTIVNMVRDRVLESHMSLETCKGVLRANDLSQVNNIILIHLSSANSDEARFKKEVEQQTGKTVFIANKNMKINLDKTPF